MPSTDNIELPEHSNHARESATTAERVISSNSPMCDEPLANVSPIKRSNAFAELMASSKKAKPTAAPAVGSLKAFDKAKKSFKNLDPRNGLAAYLEHPDTNPEGRVVEYDDDFVVIRDKFPKASVHLLIIPRDPAYYTQHPLHVLSTDSIFLAEVQKRVTRVKQLAASELRRQYGQISAADAPYQAALEEVMSSPDPPDTAERRDALLPPGRDWMSEIVAGVHTHPSMNHLHIHVFSREMQSPWLKHKKHYLSFNSTFLVQMAEFPLPQGSSRLHPGSWPNWDMKCWRCDRNFKNKFAALKAHLLEEFDVWTKE